MAYSGKESRRQDVRVAVCGDEAFAAPAGVLFRSIMDHADPGRKYELIYFHDGISGRKQQMLESLAGDSGNVTVRCADIRPYFDKEGLRVDNRPGLSVMTYARLALPELLPEWNRVLYLDGDMIAFSDVAELFDSDLAGCPLGSTVDFGFLSTLHRDPEQMRYAKEVLGLERPEDYCMAGVLVMDLAGIRQRFAPGEMLEAARNGLWRWHDQDVLNHLFRGCIRLLDPRWDVICPEEPDGLPEHWRRVYEQALKNAKLFHFAGSHMKPWQTQKSPFAPDFWEIAGRTPFFGELMDRLRGETDAIRRLYSEPKKAKLLRKLLPPPVQSCQRDLKNVLDEIDEQTRLLLTLLRQLRGREDARPLVSAEDTPYPVRPVREKAVTVVCCGDELYAAPVGVLFRSVIEHGAPGRFYDLIYLHNGLSECSRAGLRHLSRENVSVRTCDISGLFSGEGLYVQNRQDFPVMAYARLMIPQALSEEYTKALYLDGDMVACQDVGELYDCDLGGRSLGSTVDLYYLALQRSRASHALDYRDYVEHELGVTNPEEYIISGMLLMDLEKLREEYPAMTLLNIAASRHWRWHDQAVINHVFRGRIRLLDPKWDAWHLGDAANGLSPEWKEIYKQTLTAPGIFHYAGAGAKPWQRTFPPYSRYFWGHARNTPFYTELLWRLHRELDTYKTHYPQKGEREGVLKRLLKKILPPPVDSFQRDLKTVLNTLDEQKQLTFLLMQQLEELKGGASASKPSRPVAKVPNRTLRFEFSLASHCNLNCGGCSHFAPVAKEEFPDFAEADRDFARLSELFGGTCEYIHLMGGEPLLNPECGRYLAMARKHFPVGKIQLVTNGLLLPKQTDEFYRVCRENRITISVTPYPVKLDLKGIEARCASLGVSFECYPDGKPRTHFNRLVLEPEGRQDPHENFRRCWYSNVCLFLRKGKLYPCGIGAHMRIFEEHFHAGLSLGEENSVDIYRVDSGSELLRDVAKPVPMCRYCRLDCREETIPWHRSEKRLEEWVYPGNK